MSDEPKTATFQLTPENSVTIGCPTCHEMTKDQRLDIAGHLPTAQLCIFCRRCKKPILALGLSIDGYKHIVAMKLNQNEPSRILVPKMGPRGLN